MKKHRQIIRRMGFVRDQEGIINRYIRESSNWKNHLERTRNFITASFNRTEAESVAVLGSGWLLDVPLDHLLKRFKHIYLVDIHHPIQIRKLTAGMSQVELIEEVVTKNGDLSSKALLHTNLPGGIRNDSWWWDFESQGTCHPGSRTRMEVQAVEWT